MGPPADAERHAMLEALFAAHFQALLAYARRRTEQLADAEDVVGETFGIVWRRMADLPVAENERRPWLYGIARNVIANQRRGARRRVRLAERLRAAMRPRPARPPLVPDAIDALSRLRPPDQEILRLAAWEGLTHAEAAIVLGITPNAAAIRLHRARARLRAELKGSVPSRTWIGWKGSAEQSVSREESS